MKTTHIRALGICLAAALLLAPQVLAQNPTGDLTGTVTDSDRGALPGVTVTATSPNLQGARSSQTGANGGYKLALLPPGEYRVTYEMDGFATTVKTVKISAAQTLNSDIEMSLSEVTEEIVVTSNLETISETGTVATTYTKEEVEKLPIARTIASYVNLAPGVHNTAPAAGNAISINGAMSFENLFMVNGVVINENVRGGSLPLFIEDAVQETTTSTASVSAEYGRFTGGVVNVITKSGGNQFSGSIRANLDNDDWSSNENNNRFGFDPFVDDINEEFEATLGGPIWRDRIWFFLAGRDRETTGTGNLGVPVNTQFATSDEETRTEAKLTIGLTPSHSLIGSFTEIDRTRAGSTFGTFLELDMLNNRTDPQEITSFNYTGIVTSNFFIEAQYSEREFIIAAGFGGPSPNGPRTIANLIPGTAITDRATGRRFHSSTFCADCELEQRDNENTLVKGSYFLSTESAGSHDLVFGYDTFTDIRFSINHQSGSDFDIRSTSFIFERQQNIVPVFDTGTFVIFWPPFNLDIAAPTDFTTNSFFINDSWQLNDRWSFNLGVRFDENDGQDSGGTTTVDDSKFSPRFGASWDVKGDGDMVFNASLGTYVAAVANTRADATSQGGALGGFGVIYTGPSVNTNCDAATGANCVSTEDALATLLGWWAGQGGSLELGPGNAFSFPSGAPIIVANVPGGNAFVPDTLRSPAADEITLGITKRLGSKGLFRADVVFREWEDFYSDRTTLETGRIDTAAGVLDLTEVGNFGDNVLEREYWGLNVQGRYRITDRLTVAGNYTLSELEGNINGETPGSGPVTVDPNAYPEFTDPRWAFPVGDLSADQRHKVRAWLIYDILDNEHHNLNVSLLQNFLSGTPYGLNINAETELGTPGGDFIASQCPACFDPNTGYVTPPTQVAYAVLNRDNFRTDDITRTDVSLNYSFRWNAFGRSMEVFVQPEITNLFGEDAVVGPDTSGVFDATDGGQCRQASGAICESFNPFTETPVEGVHYTIPDTFNQPDSPGDIQAPRTFLVSLGFRF